MRAILAGHGSDWVMADMPMPRAGHGQVLIRNRASATNNADLPMLAEADPARGGTGEEVIAGFEYAGEIAALGPDAGDTFAQCLPATAVDGHVVNIGRLAGSASTIDLDALSYRHLTVHGVSFGFSRDWETVPILQRLRTEVLPAVARGRIGPVIDSTVRVEQFQQAADRLRSGEAIGKTVLTFA